jgi:hypothetical protein
MPAKPQHTRREHTRFTLAEPRKPPRKRTPRVTTFLKFLDANPGQWAIFRTFPTQGHEARKRVHDYRTWYGPRGYEFTHEIDGKVTKLYGRKVVPELADNTRDC